MWQAALLSDAADFYCFIFSKTMWCFISSFPIYTPTKSTGSATTKLFSRTEQNRTEQNALLCCEPVFLIRRRLPQYFTGSITTCFGWEIIRILQIINKMAVSWSQSVKGSSGMNGGRSTPDIGLYGFCVCHLCVIWPPIQWSLSIVTVAVNSSVPEA
jgi:hypothetical protein